MHMHTKMDDSRPHRPIILSYGSLESNKQDARGSQEVAKLAWLVLEQYYRIMHDLYLASSDGVDRTGDVVDLAFWP